MSRQLWRKCSISRKFRGRSAAHVFSEKRFGADAVTVYLHQLSALRTERCDGRQNADKYRSNFQPPVKSKELFSSSHSLTNFVIKSHGIHQTQAG